MAAKKQLMEKVAEKEIAELEWTTIEEADAEDKWEVVESYAEQPSYKRRGGR